jgi:hypothetical protein
VIGLVAFRQYRREQTWALWTFALYVPTLNAVIAAKNPRHRAVLIPIFILGAVQGVSWLVRRVRQEEAEQSPSHVLTS